MEMERVIASGWKKWSFFDENIAAYIGNLNINAENAEQSTWQAVSIPKVSMYEKWFQNGKINWIIFQTCHLTCWVWRAFRSISILTSLEIIYVLTSGSNRKDTPSLNTHLQPSSTAPLQNPPGSMYLQYVWSVLFTLEPRMEWIA